MVLSRISIVMVAVAMGLLLFFPVTACAGLDETENERGDIGVPLPFISRGQGDNCVDDTEFMRRNHMTMLRHQRDQTIREGIRGRQYSLKQCVDCHAVSGPDAMPVTIASPNHFCRSCHDYAAVKIDCFQCHASRPESELPPGDHGRSNGLPTVQATTGGVVGIK
jgi:hypothetical protein